MVRTKIMLFLGLVVLVFIISGCGNQSAQISTPAQSVSLSDYVLV